MIQALPTGRRGQALAIALGVLALSVLWFGAIDPVLSLYADRGRLLEQRQALRDHMSSLAATLPSLQAASRRPAEGGTTLLAGDSDAVAAANLQELVQRMAASAGTSVTAVETLPAETDGNWHKISLRISLNATWPVLMQLLQAIEQAPMRILMDDLHFHSPLALLHPVAMPIQASLVVYGFRSGAR